MDTLLSLKYMNLKKDGKRGWLTLDRPEALNAFNNEGTEQLNQAAMVIREDPDIRVLVIRGNGRAFCTGIDLKELASNQIDMSYHHRFETALRIFETMEKIVVVGMHGYCLGGGLQLALAADIRGVTPECQIGLPAIRESLIPGLSTWRLPKYIGWGRAKKMILGGENIDGHQALDIGLADHILDDQHLFEQLDTVAEQYLKACSAGMRLSKILINQAYELNFEGMAQSYYELQQRAQYSLDARNASKAYLSGKTPEWQ